MNEISIQLTEVNPTIFYGGSKSKNITILKRYFPKIKIVARGETITAFGEEEILEEFEKISGFPILLNTSFNINGEPIVCSPDDAINTFFNSGLDILMLGDCCIKK